MDGVGASLEGFGDLGDGVALHEVLKHLGLALGEPWCRLGCGLVGGRLAKGGVRDGEGPGEGCGQPRGDGVEGVPGGPPELEREDDGPGDAGRGEGGELEVCLGASVGQAEGVELVVALGRPAHEVGWADAGGIVLAPGHGCLPWATDVEVGPSRCGSEGLSAPGGVGVEAAELQGHDAAGADEFEVGLGELGGEVWRGHWRDAGEGPRETEGVSERGLWWFVAVRLRLDQSGSPLIVFSSDHAVSLSFEAFIGWSRRLFRLERRGRRKGDTHLCERWQEAGLGATDACKPKRSDAFCLGGFGTDYASNFPS